MEMRVRADIDIGEDITPPIPPLAFSLYDAFLLSHCSACFSPLHIPTFSINSHCIPSPPSIPSHFLYYCSPHCSNADSHLHLSSAEHHLFLLLRSDTSTWHGGDFSDLRTALRLLFHFENLGLLSPHRTQFLARIGGLMSNLDKLTTRQNPEDDEILARIRDGGKAMAIARRRMRGGGADFSGDTVLEEAVLCQVLTNAVEVQVNGGHALGIAVYDSTFSWINHSCSPNACYRFSLSALPPERSHCSDKSRLRIIPATDGVGNGDETEVENGGCSISKLNKGCQGYGPRIIVRSIKVIKKGEEVSVAYTDLLQPTAIRQSELWLKYRFICCCRRCSAFPPTYVDHALQEISAANLDCTNRSSDHNFYRDKAIRKLTDYIDDVITEYLSGGNPESCCEKLENMLTQGHPDEQLEPKDGKSQPNIRLHPLQSLALNAYTTLASAYKIRASHLLTLHPELNDHQLEAFDMSRTSAAYSLLLAGATHHLFLSEYSLIASVANFWTSAGESLLSLARSSVWNLFVNWGLPVINISSLPSHKCCSCSLMDKFEANSLCCRARNSEFEDITREFLDCITNITPEVWRVLIHGCHYLKVVKDPIDFRWLGTKKNFNIWDFQGHLGGTDVGSDCGTEGGVSRCEARRYSNQERINLFQLGFHCLLYGWFLSSICYGQHSHLTCYIQNLLYGEET